MTPEEIAAANASPAPAAPPPITTALEVPKLNLPVNVQMTNFEDDSIKQFEFDQYKGTKNRTDRIGILYPNSIAIGRVHYTDGEIKGYVLCQSEIKAQAGAEVIVKAAPCCEILKEPKKRFGVLVAQYRTDKDGNLVQPFGYDLKIWVFGVDKYAELRSLNREFPLAAHDLKLACSDENFQKMTIQACRESVIASPAFQAKPEAKQVAEWAQAMLSKLPKALGKTLSVAEFSKLSGGVATAATVESSAPALDVADLLK